jgi:hypothetical protein
MRRNIPVAVPRAPLRRSCDYAAPMFCMRRNCMEDLRPSDDRAKNNLTNFCKVGCLTYSPPSQSLSIVRTSHVAMRSTAFSERVGQQNTVPVT